MLDARPQLRLIAARAVRNKVQCIERFPLPRIVSLVVSRSRQHLGRLKRMQGLNRA